MTIANIEPTDKSIPPVIIVNVIPIAIKLFIVASSIISIKFEIVKYDLSNIVNTNTKINIAANTANSLL